MNSPLDTKGICSFCKSHVGGAYGHSAGCAWGDYLYAAAHPEVCYWTPVQVERTLERARKEQWITPIQSWMIPYE